MSRRWAILGHLKVGQAVALPITEEAGGGYDSFTMAPRLTPHVRHREQDVDVPVAQDPAFVFGASGYTAVRRVRTLRQFVIVLESLPARSFDGYLRRGDFSRWIQQVFGDGTLASELRALEARYRNGRGPDVVTDVVAAVRAGTTWPKRKSPNLHSPERAGKPPSQGKIPGHAGGSGRPRVPLAPKGPASLGATAKRFRSAEARALQP